MLSITIQLSFSAKIFSQNTLPSKKSSQREREYLRPSEVNAIISAAQKVGRYGITDGAIIWRCVIEV
ncbi:hypothetical protein FNW02_36135 [Komarekiella sp. 'clone 1']|uniref:Uncharacterized protein n=1 Tax=Komarekiella delphini-convector SJRDD-AB1 TaxID=2593771 RepID=A0AA40VVF8_9NOST|nr:hypothetical protein [Komarekiella delphini-convector]MBD6621013.1 hypothetical protein [Komarekiella delphini-convector SJRDD-AB1]